MSIVAPSSSDIATAPRTQRATWFAVAVLAGCLVIRAALMVTLPLSDTTEARYGEIARQMVAGGSWLMLHEAPDLPFFAKPPLSTWLEAISATVFGVHEWALRLPAFFATAVALAAMAASMLGATRERRWRAIAIAGSTPLVLVCAGAVMTDAVQMMCVSLAMLCATHALFDLDAARARRWAWALGAVIGVGMLAKGLATVALIALPIGSYAIVTRQIGATWRRTVTVPGVALAVAIALPWYWAAEVHYPGFLRYFLIGEHFARFLDAGWQGDRYGRAHAMPLGTIWAFWAAAILPWLAVFVIAARETWRTRGRAPVAGRASAAWWWCWCLAPLVFFTLTKNLIWTYALTSIPPFAIVAASMPARPRAIVVGAAAAIVLVVIAAIVGPRYVEAQSVRALVAATDEDDRPLPVTSLLQFSAAFYTRGHAEPLHSVDEAAQVLAQPGRLAIVDVRWLDALRSRCRFDTIASHERAALVRSR